MAQTKDSEKHHITIRLSRRLLKLAALSAAAQRMRYIAKAMEIKKMRIWTLALVLGLLATPDFSSSKPNLTAPKEGATNIIKAELNRACAPWDGPAFTLTIPMGTSGSKKGFPWIQVSIWQPDVRSGKEFHFPDRTAKIGTAWLKPKSGTGQELRGTVVFRSGTSGEFDLATSAGERFHGKFRAEWTDFQPLCG